MMLIGTVNIQDENTRRMRVGACGALAFHALILIYVALPISNNLISADLYSPPTNVTIRFTQPVKQEIKKTEPVKKMPTKANVKPIEPKPEILDTIEPAAYEPPQKVIEPKPVEQVTMTPPKYTPEAVPVVTEVNLKGRRVRPQYPKRALKLRQEGVVWLRVLVDEQGEQEELKVHRPSQYALLNQAAMKAVKKWEFEPTKRFGRAIKSWVEIPIEFAIQ